MDKEQVTKLMRSSSSTKEWNDNCDVVKRACNGYPSFWYAEIIQSGLSREVLAEFGESPDFKSESNVMPPRQVTLTETEWQHIYELLEEDTKSRQFMSEEYRVIFKQLNDGILRKFDGAQDILDLECFSSPTGKHSNTRGIGTFGVYQCRYCHKEIEE